jgi:hypothetical protein
MTTKQKGDTLLAMVALNTPELPAPATVLATFAERCPDAPAPGDLGEQDGIVIFHLDDEMVAISLMPAPIPWSDLEGPCATAWWWPEATERMRGHNSHVIVALMGGSDVVVERHLRLSHLIAAVAAHADAAGVYWGAGTVVHEPAAFVEQTANLTPKRLEPLLWIDMRLEQNKDGSFRYFTTGLAAFGHLEIEIDRSRREPKEIFDFCYGIVKYVLTGAVIKDNETIGRSAEEKIRVRHQPSMFDRGTVMKLAFT